MVSWLHGYTPEMVRRQPSFGNRGPELEDMLACHLDTRPESWRPIVRVLLTEIDATVHNDPHPPEACRIAAAVVPPGICGRYSGRHRIASFHEHAPSCVPWSSYDRGSHIKHYCSVPSYTSHIKPHPLVCVSFLLPSGVQSSASTSEQCTQYLP